MRQNKQINYLEEENKIIEKEISNQPFFNKIVVTDPIILFPDQWERLKCFSRQIVPAGEQTSIDELYKHALEEKKPVCWTQLAANPLEGKELEEKVKDADAIIACWTTIHDEVIKNSKDLKYIGYWTNLASHRVNKDLAKELGIQVDYVPDYGSQAVASQTLTGILSVLRNLNNEIKMTQEGKWHHELLKTRQRVPLTEDQIPQEDLWYKKIGIVGWGPIAQQFSKLALPFECELNYWSRKRRDINEEKEYKVNYMELEELFSKSDIISIHLNPYSGDKIISKELINKIKPGSIFVNTSAGSLIDQEALFRRLGNKELRAYLDVYEALPPKTDIRELSKSGNIFTYRAGWFTKDAVRLKGEMFLRNIERYIQLKN